MKQVITTTVFLLLILFSTSFKAQSTLTEEEATEYAERLNLAGGTYQIQVIDSREKPAIQLSVINDIDNARKENDVAYVYIKENIRIKVLPLSIIKDENFVAIERIIYLKSSQL